jgi:hypothetical protein
VVEERLAGAVEEGLLAGGGQIAELTLQRRVVQLPRIEAEQPLPSGWSPPRPPAGVPGCVAAGAQPGRCRRRPTRPAGRCCHQPAARALRQRGSASPATEEMPVRQPVMGPSSAGSARSCSDGIWAPGNPAAGPLVTHLLPVVLVLGCCLPGQAGSPCTPLPSTGDLRPPFFRGCPSLLCGQGARPRAGPLAPGAAATLAIQRTRTRQPCSQHMVVIGCGNRHIKGAQEAMGFRFVRRCPGGVPGPWQCAGGFACALDDPVLAPSRPKTVSRSGWGPWPTR